MLHRLHRALADTGAVVTEAAEDRDGHVPRPAGARGRPARLRGAPAGRTGGPLRIGGKSAADGRLGVRRALPLRRRPRGGALGRAAPGRPATPRAGGFSGRGGRMARRAPSSTCRTRCSGGPSGCSLGARPISPPPATQDGAWPKPTGGRGDPATSMTTTPRRAAAPSGPAPRGGGRRTCSGGGRPGSARASAGRSSCAAPARRSSTASRTGAAGTTTRASETGPSRRSRAGRRWRRPAGAAISACRRRTRADAQGDGGLRDRREPGRARPRGPPPPDGHGADGTRQRGEGSLTFTDRLSRTRIIGEPGGSRGSACSVPSSRSRFDGPGATGRAEPSPGGGPGRHAAPATFPSVRIRSPVSPSKSMARPGSSASPTRSPREARASPRSSTTMRSPVDATRCA